MQTQLTRRTLSTEREYQEWCDGRRLARPAANVSWYVLTLADGTVEHHANTDRHALQRATLAHTGQANHIIQTRWLRQPRHLLTSGS